MPICRRCEAQGDEARPFTIQRAALVPISVVREHAARVEYVNAWRLILRDSVWAVPGVQDVTDRIRAAATATDADRGEP